MGCFDEVGVFTADINVISECAVTRGVTKVVMAATSAHGDSVGVGVALVWRPRSFGVLDIVVDARLGLFARLGDVHNLVLEPCLGLA